MGKLAKVELHYEDGTVTSLDGEDADKWLLACNAMVASAYVHGFRMPAFTWRARKEFTEVSPGLFVSETSTSIFNIPKKESK